MGVEGASRSTEPKLTYSATTIEEIFVELYGSIIGRSGSTAELKFRCPVCGKKSLSCNTVTGLCHCFKCGYGKGESPVKGKPSKQKTTPIDNELQSKLLTFSQAVSNIPPHYREYLKKRGVYNPEAYGIFIPTISLLMELRSNFTEEELEFSGLFYRFDGTLELTPALSPGRIAIPYYEGTKLIACKARRNPFFFNEGDLKYLQPRGSIAGSMVWSKLDPSADYLILTEGELKAITAIEHGFNCVGSSGMNISAAAINYLTRLSKGISKIFVAYDRDADNNNALKEALGVWKRFRERAAIVVFPHTGFKVDLDSFILNNGIEALEALLQESWEKRKETVRWIENGFNV